ncbi:MAG: L,D-transpeptidase [Polyangia bacterium]
MRVPSRALSLLILVAAGGAVAGCDPEGQRALAPDSDLPIGDLVDEGKADGTWGSALTCKAVPSLPTLVSPRIIVSLDGLTLHLVDAAGFDKIFPIGPGAINHNQGETSYGESLSLYPVLATGQHEFSITPSSIQPCKFWWTDPETGVKSPVFAGLPFLSWYGNYAIHGPIDNFRAPNGGNLRRGYVSHGCIRMGAADILEVYARIKGLAKIPVHVQKEPERASDGRRVDVPNPWIGAECTSDADCTMSGGFCHPNQATGRGFCSAACTSTCADRAGYPTTFCVADPANASRGMCVEKQLPQDEACRPFDGLKTATRARFGQPAVSASVCVPPA